MNTRNRTTIAASAVLLAAALAVGCGADSISSELVDARKTLLEARNGPAGQYEPAQLRRAERMLERAEEADNGSSIEVHYAYLADRRARVAMADAESQRTMREVARLEQSYQQDLEEMAVASGALRDREQALAAEREALDRLSQLANVSDDGEGNSVITLSGEVLFETGKASLLPTARQRLEGVATALNLQPERSIRIEGHTDSTGSRSLNQELSERRADVVRRFLIERGVAASRVTSEGRGEAEPIADNRSPEGRANNRRVEIILGPNPRFQHGGQGSSTVEDRPDQQRRPRDTSRHQRGSDQSRSTTGNQNQNQNQNRSDDRSESDERSRPQHNR